VFGDVLCQGHKHVQFLVAAMATRSFSTSFFEKTVSSYRSPCGALAVDTAVNLADDEVDRFFFLIGERVFAPW